MVGTRGAWDKGLLLEKESVSFTPGRGGGAGTPVALTCQVLGDGEVFNPPT